jgi:hypothetical protein
MDLEIACAPGRYLLPLSDRWLLVALAPVPGVIVLGLFLDGALVELVDDPLDVLGYLRASATFRRSSRSSSPFSSAPSTRDGKTPRESSRPRPKP